MGVARGGSPGLFFSDFRQLKPLFPPADPLRMAGSYRELDASAIEATLVALERRVRERFPATGLVRVIAELRAVAAETVERIERLRAPNVGLRVAVAGLLALIAGILVATVLSFRWPDELDGLPQLVQVAESAINDVVFVGIVVVFLLTLESRLRRRHALRAMHELRSLAHVVDMHQLTKDPEQFSPEHRETASSPVRPLTRYELARYLDYCSETLSLTSKVAALWAQRFEDAVVLGAVNEVEALTTGLSSKIWQKLSILDAARRTEAGADPNGGASR